METAEEIHEEVLKPEENEVEEMIKESEVVEEIILPCDASQPALTAAPEAQNSEIDTKNAVADSDEIAIAGDTISDVKIEDWVPCEERIEEEVFVRESTPPAAEEPAKERPSPESQDEIIAASPCPSVPEVELKIEPEEQPEIKTLHCCRCKVTQSWMWKRTPSGSFLCTACEAREQDIDEIAPTPRRTHKDSVVLLENEHTDSNESKPSSEVPGKGEVVSEIDAAGSAEALAASLMPTRKSSRSTRSTISNSNPYAYPRPVMAKPKEKKSVAKFIPSYVPPTPQLSLTHKVRYKGTYMQMGDIVSVRGHDGGIYYAQIRGLLEDQFCEKSAALTWLLPTENSPPPEKGFDPDSYIIGMEEDVPRSLDCMDFVMHAPSDYFKIRQPYGFIETYGNKGSSLML